MSHPRRLESSGVNDIRHNEIPSCFCHHENINVQWKVISIYLGGEGGPYVIKMWNLHKVCLREKYFCNDELTKGWVKWRQEVDGTGESHMCSFFKLLPQFLNHILIKQHHMIYFSNECKSANTKNTVVLVH